MNRIKITLNKIIDNEKIVEIDPFISMVNDIDKIGIWNGYHNYEYYIKDIEKIEFEKIKD